jgi:hypothetical protein
LRAQKKPVDDRLKNGRNYDACHQSRRRDGQLTCDTPMGGIKHEKLSGLLIKKSSVDDRGFGCDS